MFVIFVIINNVEIDIIIEIFLIQHEKIRTIVKVTRYLEFDDQPTLKHAYKITVFRPL